MTDAEKRSFKDKLFLIEMILAVGLILAIGSRLLPGGVTGFVSVETETQNISVELGESGEFRLSSVDGAALPIVGFGVSGSAEGGVAIFLANQRGEQYLVFTNVQNATKRIGRITSIAGITGAAVGETGAPVEAPVALVFEPGGLLPPFPVPDGYVVWDGAFQQECAETCVLPSAFADSTYLLRVYLAEGARLDLREISYTVVKP